jgi:hypothetical protein
MTVERERSIAAPGATTAIGSLPHRDARAAARLSLSSLEIPAVPSLPRRSPAEGMIAQAVVGLRGVSLGQYGSIAVDIAEIDPAAPVLTDIGHDAFGGLRAFLDEASGHGGPVKWQFAGPVTLGLALVRAGLSTSVAFRVALTAVRAHLSGILDAVDAALPGSPQLVFLDEPSLGAAADPEFPLDPEAVLDLLSGALAVVEQRATAGVHCCDEVDWSVVTAAGPAVVSVPAAGSLVQQASHIARFLDAGGTVAWGAVPTDRPLPPSADRLWRQLSDVWCGLVGEGVDPRALRRQSLVTPACGLALHDESTAGEVHRLLGEVGRRVRDQAVATRLIVGA